MKALFVSNDPALFNPESEVRARMRAYAKAIGELHIVSPGPRDAEAVEEEGLFLHPIHAWGVFRAGALARKARALIRAHDIAVVSAQDPFEHGLAALRATTGTRAKLHVQVHTDFLSPWFVRGALRTALLNRYRQALARRVLPKAAGIRVVSERVRHSLAEYFGTHIVTPSVIPIAVDAAVPVPVPLPAHDFKFALMAAGRLEPEKRLGDILEALAQLQKHYPMAGLFIVGAGRERAHLMQEVARLKLQKRVIIIDRWLPADEVRGMMASAHAFVQASAYEGYGRTLIEAALAQVPIVTTDVGIVGEVFTPGKAVLATPVADPVAFAGAISRLIEDTALRYELPMQAAAAARAHLARVGDLPARIAEDLAGVMQKT